jgi:hypothetical protein
MKHECLSASEQLYAVLKPRASDGELADRFVDELFARVIAVVRKDTRFTSLTLLELELKFADLHRDFAARLFGLLHEQLDLHDAVDLIASRFFGED